MSAPPVGHRFKKGHKKLGGRQKGSKNIRSQALTGLARGGIKIARANGVNTKVDGLAHFFEDLAVKNSGAAATLAGKLISSEPPPDTSGIPATVAITVNPIARGQAFSPGRIVLMPFEDVAIAWEAFNGGDERWKAYLKENEALFTAPAFEKLSLLEAPEPGTQPLPSSDVEPQDTAEPDDDRSNVVPLRALDAAEGEQRTIEGLKAEIRALSRRLGIPVVV